MTFFREVAAVLKGEFLDLDRAEAALIDAPPGDTVSLYAAMEARHGFLLARIACVLFSILIQWNHCANQAPGGKAMRPQNYVRAALCLVAPLLVAWWLL